MDRLNAPESATTTPSSSPPLDLAGTDYAATVTKTEEIIVHSGGGFDVAELHDSPDNDVLTATPTEVTLRGASFSSQALGFREVYAEAAAGGYDVASLYDSSGDDQFVGRAAVSGLRTAQSYNEVRAFDEVHAYAVNGGRDTADLYDSMGDDTFVAREDFARMSGDGYFTRAKLFEHVTGHASGGNDEAHLYDSAGDDTFFATPAAAWFSGEGWERRAENFGAGVRLRLQRQRHGNLRRFRRQRHVFRHAHGSHDGRPRLRQHGFAV